MLSILFWLVVRVRLDSFIDLCTFVYPRFPFEKGRRLRVDCLLCPTSVAAVGDLQRRSRQSPFLGVPISAMPRFILLFVL